MFEIFENKPKRPVHTAAHPVQGGMPALWLAFSFWAQMIHVVGMTLAHFQGTQVRLLPSACLVHAAHNHLHHSHMSNALAACVVLALVADRQDCQPWLSSQRQQRRCFSWQNRANSLSCDQTEQWQNRLCCSLPLPQGLTAPKTVKCKQVKKHK